MNQRTVIVLAAGQGKRMNSGLPKVLHPLLGRSLVGHVLAATAALHAARTVVVVGHGAERVTKKVQEQSPHWANVSFVEQEVQRGTGDAALVGLSVFPGDDLDDESTIVVLPGDTPLLRAATIAALVEAHHATDAACTLLTARMSDPTGYGRVVRGRDDRVERVVEQADATEDEKQIDEVNTSIYCFRASVLGPALRRISPENAQGEYYLTDVVEVLAGAGYRVSAVVADDAADTQGVNDRLQLAAAEAELRRRTNEDLLRSGVTMVDPSAVLVDTTVRVGRDVTLFPGVILQGATVVGDRTELGPNTRLVDTTVGSDCVIEQTTARESRIGDGCTVGPYASLAPGSEVPSNSTTGAFYTADPRP